MEQATILIVEDDSDIKTLLEYNFQQAGYDVIIASDGEEGLVLAGECQPQLIILDWMMPLMSGLELLRRLRGREATAQIPIIMLTAKADEADRLRGLDTGADDYVVKPFSPAELLARTRALLRRSTGTGQQCLRCGGKLKQSQRNALRARGERLLPGNLNIPPTDASKRATQRPHRPQLSFNCAPTKTPPAPRSQCNQ